MVVPHYGETILESSSSLAIDNLAVDTPAPVQRRPDEMTDGRDSFRSAVSELVQRVEQVALEETMAILCISHVVYHDDACHMMHIT